jgi:hypothetical protein
MIYEQSIQVIDKGQLYGHEEFYNQSPTQRSIK